MALSRLLFLSPNIETLAFDFSSAKTRRSATGLLRLSAANTFSSPARRGESSGIGGRISVGPGDDLPEDYGSQFPTADPRRRRRAGVLLHPTSLRGPYGIGDFGDEAIRFLDWLHATGCSVWQVLPLVPPGRKSNEDGSPYAGQDANCGNTLLISLEELVKDGLLMEDELPEPMDVEKVQYTTVANLKDPLIAKAAERLTQSQGELKLEFESFCKDSTISCWLEDAALFAAIDHDVNAFSWDEWPDSLKNRHLGGLEEIHHRNKDFISIFVAQQFLFQKQWKKICCHAHKLGITIIGDMPIYVGYHSADVWANRRSFLLNRGGFPILVSGVPPDAFSETGQLWGSPLYDWRAMEGNGYIWWIQRIKRALDLYDEFRIDHFRGLAGFWAVPSEAKIAMFGQWKAGPGKAFFDAIFRAVGKISIIAEDLGVITEDVIQLRKEIGAPGMAVLQFGFGGGTDNPHLPHNHEPDQVVYTGTHDNDTVLGWWEGLKNEEKYNVHKYLHTSREAGISWVLIHAAISSVARTAIIPMQDILSLGSSARMNTPATQIGDLQQRKCTVVFELSCNLARVLEFYTREIPQAFIQGPDMNLRRLTELIIFILNYMISVADTEFFDNSLRRPGQYHEKTNRSMIMAPLVGIILNLMDATAESKHGETIDIIGVFASMDCPLTVHCGFQYLLSYNWGNVLRGEVSLAKLAQLEEFANYLRSRIAALEGSVETATRADENEGDSCCCICYAADSDAQFEPCRHLSCFGCITRHLLNSQRCFFCNATVTKVIKIRPQS